MSYDTNRPKFRRCPSTHTVIRIGGEKTMPCTREDGHSGQHWNTGRPWHVHPGSRTLWPRKSEGTSR